eukprot:3777_1
MLGCYIVIIALIGCLRAETYGDACRWYHVENTNNILDLTHYPINGIVLNATDPHSLYQYYYSPCNLSFYSSEQDQYYAIIRYDRKNSSNIRYLVSHLNKINASIVQSQSTLTFEFIYKEENKLCSGDLQTTYIYWQCNQQILNYPDYYNITSSGSVYDCVDEIFIQSPIPCQDDQHNIKDYDDCSFNAAYNNKVYTLNLTSLFGSANVINIPNSIPNYYGLVYCLCCNTFYGHYWSMIYQPSAYYADVRTIWDINNIIEPYYNVEQNLWTFEYYYVAMGICNFVYKTTVNWGCTCDDTQYVFAEFEEDSNNCQVILNITMNELCINECHPNNTDCVYYHQLNPTKYAMLNITALNGSVIFGVEENGLSGFVYTPCNNSLTCNNKKVMTSRNDLNSNKCIEYLAIFNGTNSFIVNYNNNVDDAIWTITYLNGELCGNKTDFKFVVNWECGSSDWSIIDIDLDNECEYKTTISSKYVCE